MKKSTSLIFSIFFFCNIAFSQHWVSMGEDTIGCYGASSVVYTLFSDGDSLYVGGNFRYAGAACDTMWGIGIYDGQWHRMFRGVSSEVRAIQKYKGQLYVGGSFIYAQGTAEAPNPGYQIPNTRRIARWDTINQIWEGLPGSYGEMSSSVFAMGLWNDLLIIGGTFTLNAGQYRSVVAYDGSDYIGMPMPPNDDAVNTIVTYNGDLLIGHTGFGSGVSKYIESTNTWQKIFSTSDGVLHMEVDTFNNFLYMCGFTHISDGQNVIATSGLAMWNGFELEHVGYDCPPNIISLGFALYRGDVYAQLWSDTVCGYLPVYGFARWDGQDWHQIDGGVAGGNIVALQVHKDTLYVGGGIDTVGGFVQKGLARCYAPPGGCNYLKPRVQCMADTFYLNTTQPTVTVEFFNNNAYADNWYWNFGDSSDLWSVKDPVHEYSSAGTYNVSVTVWHDTCMKTANRTITVIDNTSTDEYTKESLQFKIYPNPTDGGITVECTLPTAKTGTLRTHHSNGGLKTTHQLQPGQNTIHIPSGDLSPGISFVSLYIENRFIFSEKVVKTK
jgi:hypothetical protein